MFGIDKIRASAYRPSINTAADRLHMTLNFMLGKVVTKSQRDWDTKVPAVYQVTVHAVAVYSPNFLMFGRKLRAPINLVLGGLQDRKLTRTSL